MNSSFSVLESADYKHIPLTIIASRANEAYVNVSAIIAPIEGSLPPSVQLSAQDVLFAHELGNINIPIHYSSPSMFLGNILVEFTVILSSADQLFDGLTETALVEFIDTDNPGVSLDGVPISPGSRIVHSVPERENSTHHLTFNTMPLDEVILKIEANQVDDSTLRRACALSPVEARIPPAKWRTGVFFEITCYDMATYQGENYFVVISFSLASSDAAYNASSSWDFTGVTLDEAILSVDSSAPFFLLNVTDIDTAGFLAPRSLTVTEGSSALLQFRLTSRPLHPLHVYFNTSNVGNGVIDFLPNPVTIDPSIDLATPIQVALDAPYVPRIWDSILNGHWLCTSDDPFYGGRSGSFQILYEDIDSPGMVISPSTIEVEEGGQSAVTFRLQSQPEADVFILSDSLFGHASTSAGNLTISPFDWNLTQSITITAFDDLVAGQQPYNDTLVFVLDSSDLFYHGLFYVVNVTIFDNDEASISISTRDIYLSEGSDANYQVAYNLSITSQPVEHVGFALKLFGDSGISVGSTNMVFSQTTVWFDASNWTTPATIFVTIIDDVKIGPESYVLWHEVLPSSDWVYLSIEAPEVVIHVSDNDSPRLVFTPYSEPEIVEGSTTTLKYSLQLGTLPAAPVTVTLTTDDLLKTSPSSLTFTTVNWNQEAIISVGIGNDNFARGDRVGTITHTITSEDSNYAQLAPEKPRITIVEDDFPGIAIIAAKPLQLPEGNTVELKVVSLSQPQAALLVSFGTERLTTYVGETNSTLSLQPEVSLSRSSLWLEPSEWNLGQTLQLTAVDDDVAWADTLAFLVRATVASSTDAVYLGLSDSFEVVVTENDAIGLALSSSLSGSSYASGNEELSLIEGSALLYRLKLLSRPLAPVSVTVLITTPTVTGIELTVTPTSIVINPEAWSIPEVLTLNVGDDSIAMGGLDYTVMHSVNGAGLYGSGASTSLTRSLKVNALVTVEENDVAGLVLSNDYIIGTEAPDSDPVSYTMKLGSQPTQTVQVALSTSSPAQVSFTPSSLTFTTMNWNVSQTISVSPIQDGLVESPIHETTIHHTVTSEDSSYSSLPAEAITVGIIDFDPSTLVDRTPAPVLLYAQLNESAWRLAVHFDRTTTRGGMSTAVAQKCSETSIFDAATISVLDSGSSPSQCRWANDTTLQVLLPVSHPLRGGATLKLRGGVIRATATSVDFASGSVVVRGRLPVPAFKSARFGNAGVTITVNFTAPTSQQVGSGFGSGACTSLLRVSGGRSLGVGATCTWQSATTLVITLGSGATVEPVSFQPQEGVAACNAGTSLQLVAGALGATSSSVLRSSGCVDIAQPASPPAPQARLVSPARIGICDDLRLDGLGSAGNAGRDLEYVWQVSDLNSFAVLTESNVSQYLADVGSVAVLSIPRELLLPDSVWRVSMTVSNFLSAVKDTTSTDVSVASDPIPQLTVQGEGSRRVRASTVVELKVIGRTPGCGGEESGKVLVYSWSLSSVSRDASATESSYQVPSIAGSTVSSWVSGDPRTLRIPSNRLTVGGVYEFKATARMAEKPNIMNEAPVRVTVVSAPLSVLLRGGNRALGSGQSFSLDASAITDPDRMATLSLRWSWSCTTQSVSRPVCLTFLLQQLGCCCCCCCCCLLSSQGEACKDANGSPVAALSSTASILTIPANTLAAGVYTFQVLVESGVSAGLIPNHYRSATASTSVTVLAGDPPNVAVPPLSSSVNRDQDVQLAGTASANTKLSWSVQDVPPSVAAAVLAASTRAGSTITIPRFTLSAGVSYTFRLTAVDLNSQMGFGEVQVVVNSPPSAGYLEASRVEAKFLQDAVDLSAKNWVDTDFDLPLTYRFAFLVGTNTTLPSTSVRSLPGEQVARGYGLVARATGLLPPQGNGPNYQVSVIGYIQDNLGAVTRATRNIQGQSLVLTVRPFVDESQSKEEQLAAVSAVAASIVEGAANEGDQEKLLSSITAVMGFLNAEDPDPCESCNENQTCVSDECVCIEGWSGESCEVPPEPVDAVVSYSEWSQCSRSCGGGVEQREVLCTPAKFGGVSCEELTNGTTIEERECNMQPCAVRIDGGWTAWSQWSACSASCSEGVGGSFSGVRSRKRSCTNPPPSPDGALCEGATVQTMVCSVQCPFPVLHCPGYSVVGGEGVECSGHGVCSVTAPDCTVDREGIDCFATCGCEDGWFDEDCGATEEEFELAQQLRSDMVSRLASSEIDSEDEEAKASVAKALENVAQNPAQLSSDAQDSVLGLANSLTGGNSSSVSSLNANSGYSILSAIGSLLQSSIQNAQVVRNLQVNDGGGNSTSSGARRLAFSEHDNLELVGRILRQTVLSLISREARRSLFSFDGPRRLSHEPHLDLAVRVLEFDWSPDYDPDYGFLLEEDEDEDTFKAAVAGGNSRGLAEMDRLTYLHRLLADTKEAVEGRAASVSTSVLTTVDKVATGVQANAVPGGPQTIVSDSLV